MELTSKVDQKKSIKFGEFLKRNTKTSWYDKHCFLFRWLFFPSVSMARLIKAKTTPKKPLKAKPGQKPEKINLKTTDLPEVGKNEDIQNYVIDLDESWQEQVRLHGKEAKFFKCINQTFRWMIFKACFLIVFGTCSQLSYAIIIKFLLSSVDEKNEGEEENNALFIYVFLIIACIMQIFPPNHGFHAIMQVMMKAKLAITVLIYKKLH